MTLLQPQNGTFSPAFGPARPVQPAKTHSGGTPSTKWHKIDPKPDLKLNTVNNLQISHSYLPVNTPAHFYPIFSQKVNFQTPKGRTVTADSPCAKPVEKVRLLHGEASSAALIEPGFLTHSLGSFKPGTIPE
jgi:hypothetical protein